MTAIVFKISRMASNTIIAADDNAWKSIPGLRAQSYICKGKVWNESKILFGVRNRIVGMPIATNGAVSPIAQKWLK